MGGGSWKLLEGGREAGKQKEQQDGEPQKLPSTSTLHCIYNVEDRIVFLDELCMLMHMGTVCLWVGWCFSLLVASTLFLLFLIDRYLNCFNSCFAFAVATRLFVIAMRGK